MSKNFECCGKSIVAGGSRDNLRSMYGHFNKVYVVKKDGAFGENWLLGMPSGDTIKLLPLNSIKGYYVSSREFGYKPLQYLDISWDDQSLMDFNFIFPLSGVPTIVPLNKALPEYIFSVNEGAERIFDHIESNHPKKIETCACRASFSDLDREFDVYNMIFQGRVESMLKALGLQDFELKFKLESPLRAKLSAFLGKWGYEVFNIENFSNPQRAAIEIFIGLTIQKNSLPALMSEYLFYDDLVKKDVFDGDDKLFDRYVAIKNNQPYIDKVAADELKKKRSGFKFKNGKVHWVE
jgi:hypothetical protein